MNSSSSVAFITSRRMNIYDPMNQLSSWLDGFRDDNCPNISAPTLLDFEERVDNQSEDTSHGGLISPTHNYEQQGSRSSEKIQRRLAQNREAARKSRLRKKAYVQQLESSRLKLVQMEQELQQARKQGFYVGSKIDPMSSSSSNTNSGIAEFDMEYGNWLEEQKKQVCKLRAALQAHKTDAELKILIEINMKHYSDLFGIKGNAAKTNVFYVISGMWKSPAERFFFWIGGFRPSELLKVLSPLIEPLDDKQRMDVSNLTQSCQQAEDALSQGMDRLQQTLAESVAAGQMDEGSYIPQMTIAVDNLDALVSFVTQADHLRQEALQQMQRILTIRQGARCLLVLGEYFQRLIALSSLWAIRNQEAA